MHWFELVVWIVVGITSPILVVIIAWMLYLKTHPKKMQEVFGSQTKVANFILIIAIASLVLAAHALTGERHTTLAVLAVLLGGAIAIFVLEPYVTRAARSTGRRLNEFLARRSGKKGKKHS